MNKKAFYHLVWLGSLFLLCSQPNQPIDLTAPMPPEMITMRGPSSLNAPAEIRQKADEVNQWFLFAAQMFAGVETVTPEVNGNIFQWQVPLGEGDIMRFIKAVRRSDKSVDWTVRWDGQAEDGTIYNDRTILIGKAGKNNRSQSWAFYDIISGVETNKISWQKDSAGNVTLVYYFPIIKGEWKLVNRMDNSGSYTFSLNRMQQFVAEWSADGSGIYYDYRGNQPLSGQWD